MCETCSYRAYIYSFCKMKCSEDAIALLKAQEPHIIPRDDIQSNTGAPV